MSNITEKIIAKYFGEIDEIVAQTPSNGYIRADVAKTILYDALCEYERVNSTPRVDFWGQPI